MQNLILNLKIFQRKVVSEFKHTLFRVLGFDVMPYATNIKHTKTFFISILILISSFLTRSYYVKKVCYHSIECRLYLEDYSCRSFIIGTQQTGKYHTKNLSILAC